METSVLVLYQIESPTLSGRPVLISKDLMVVSTLPVKSTLASLSVVMVMMAPRWSRYVWIMYSHSNHYQVLKVCSMSENSRIVKCSEIFSLRAKVLISSTAWRQILDYVCTVACTNNETGSSVGGPELGSVVSAAGNDQVLLTSSFPLTDEDDRVYRLHVTLKEDGRVRNDGRNMSSKRKWWEVKVC